MTCSNDDYLKKVASHTISLLQIIGDTKALREELDYYKPDSLRSGFPTINHFHVRLSDSIRNTGRMRLVITDDRFKVIANQLLSHSLDSICNGGIELVTRIVYVSCQLSESDQNGKRSWRIFKQGVVDSACYLKSFRDSQEFYSYVDGKVGTVDQAWDLALELDMIKGIGPALACDFLKEIGVDSYGKPDVHIKRTFGKLKMIGKVNQDKEAFKVLWRMACLSSCSPAIADKILWMAASGRWDKTLDKNLDKAEQKNNNYTENSFLASS